MHDICTSAACLAPAHYVSNVVKCPGSSAYAMPYVVCLYSSFLVKDSGGKLLQMAENDYKAECDCITLNSAIF